MVEAVVLVLAAAYGVGSWWLVGEINRMARPTVDASLTGVRRGQPATTPKLSVAAQRRMLLLLVAIVATCLAAGVALYYL